MLVRKLVEQFLYCFFFLSILFIPVALHSLPFQQMMAQVFFGKSIEWISTHFFNGVVKNLQISSDAASLYILLLLVFMLSVVISCLLMVSKWWHKNKDAVLAILNTSFSYYLSLQMLLYGFDKIFGSQFYTPEPNTLYTPLGEISRDLLYWSTMGTSHTYNIFLGVIEVIAAVLLLSGKTRTLGLLLVAAIMTHVAAVNFSFDISVKVLSSFLLLLSLFLVSSQVARLYKFLILQKPMQLKAPLQLPPVFQQRFVRTTIKTFVICVFFFEVFYGLILFKDDAAPPQLHGAYAVQEIMTNGERIPLHLSPVKRVFIHRDGYLIFQDQDDKMQDFKLEADNSQHQLVFFSNNLPVRLAYHLNEKEKTLDLQYSIAHKTYLLKTRALNWKGLPALQNNFHWTVDGL